MSYASHTMPSMLTATSGHVHRHAHPHTSSACSRSLCFGRPNAYIMRISLHQNSTTATTQQRLGSLSPEASRRVCLHFCSVRVVCVSCTRHSGVRIMHSPSRAKRLMLLRLRNRIASRTFHGHPKRRMFGLRLTTAYDYTHTHTHTCEEGTSDSQRIV